MTPLSNRLACIEQARRSVLACADPGPAGLAPWLLRSWQRCLAAGMRPNQSAHFEAVSATLSKQTIQANEGLKSAAQETLHNLARTIRNTRYFVILTNADGVVIDACGDIDPSDRHAQLITRVGTDLSESALGTTAISATLAELHPVWLHRGEHFLEATSVYSCAGSPLFGPQGQCVGMLDVTGVNVVERPELKHLVTQAAHRIENQMVLAGKQGLALRVNWPGVALGTDADGLIHLDMNGCVQGANPAARDMISTLTHTARPHCSELFGMDVAPLVDATRQTGTPLDLPLWSGLRLQGVVTRLGTTPEPVASVPALRDMQASLIRRALQDAQGNVAQAAAALGISRATLYRRLKQRARSNADDRAA